jgi:uncharacterized phage-associated protein
MNARVTFNPKPDKLVDTMLYLASKGIELSQYKMVKLLYLADREHLRRFGRPITFDKYVAMPFGPVASAAFDLLKGKKALGVDPSDLPFERRKHDKIVLVERPKRDIDRAIFSRSDLMVLDQTVEDYGQMSFDQLYKLTHEHFAYDRAWKSRKTKADEMRFEDFLAEDASKDDRVSDLSFTSKGM